ncbi:UNVERIFIED_CONTAM: hypothetical protein K2H54_033512 [Gekko kuhli]
MVFCLQNHRVCPKTRAAHLPTFEGGVSPTDQLDGSRSKPSKAGKPPLGPGNPSSFYSRDAIEGAMDFLKMKVGKVQNLLHLLLYQYEIDIKKKPAKAEGGGR